MSKFHEILANSISSSFHNNTFEKAGVEFIESEEDKILQNKFNKLIVPGHYCYGTEELISTVFLRKYKFLL